MTPERRNRLEHLVNNRQNDLTVVLENVFDPHNVSAVMRTCDAVGIMEIYIVNTRIPTHKGYCEFASSSARKWILPKQYTNTKECFDEVRKKYTSILCTHLGETSKNVYDIDLTQPTALVFGNEKYGISDEARSYSNGNFIIPQVGIIRSLNISVACAVSVYEAFRQKTLKNHYGTKKLTHEEEVILLKHWNEERFLE